MIAKGKAEFHEVVDLFPAATGEDRDALKKDISANGVLVPVLFWQGKIVDGRNRVSICEELGIDYPTEEFEGTEAELVSRVLSLNFTRRHLTPSQKAAIAANARLLEKHFANSGRPGGRNGRNSPPSGRAVEKVAKEVGVNRDYVQKAATVRDKAPDVLQQVISGEKSLPSAYDEVTSPPAPENDEEKTPEIRDCLGHLVTGDLVGVFAELEVFKVLEATLKHAKKMAKEICEVAAGVRVDKVKLMADLNNALKEVQAKRPYTICPCCESDGCKTCEHTGWINESLFKCLPEEQRNEWIEKGKADVASF